MRSPATRDVWIALVTCVAAVVLKVLKGRLSFALSKQNAVEAVFPVVVLLAVLGGIEIVRAARGLMREVANETIEVSTDSGLLNAEGGMIVRPVRVVMPFYRIKIVSIAALLITVLILVGILSWRLYIPATAQQAASGASNGLASPSPAQTHPLLFSPLLLRGLPHYGPESEGQCPVVRRIEC